MPSAIVQAQRPRFNRIMRGIASALYFNEFGERFPYKWRVHSAHMLSEKQAFLDLPDELTPQVNALLRSVPVTDRDTNQPEVFQYGLYRGEKYQAIYRLRFYGSVDTYVWGIPLDDQDDD